MKKDLHFNLGAGLQMRARLISSGLIKDLSKELGDIETPELSTGFHTVASLSPDEEGVDARDLMPEALCAGGLCNGALPGCSQGKYAKKHYPKLVFDFQRPFLYQNMTKGRFHGLMKRALAYAFSALPIMLKVAIREIQKEGLSDKRAPLKLPKIPDPLGFLDDDKTTTEAPPAGWEAASSEGSSSAAESGGSSQSSAANADSALDSWYTRRLTATGGALGEHQAALTFTDGVPYVVDRPLVEMMLQHGYFLEIEDDAGPLHIVDFHISSADGSSSRNGVLAPGDADALSELWTSSEGAAAVGLDGDAGVHPRWQPSTALRNHVGASVGAVLAITMVLVPLALLVKLRRAACSRQRQLRGWAAARQHEEEWEQGAE